MSLGVAPCPGVPTRGLRRLCGWSGEGLVPLVPLLVGRSPKGSNGPKDTLLVFGVGVADGVLFPVRFGGKGGESVMLCSGSGVGT